MRRRSRSYALSEGQAVNRHYAIIEAPSVLGLRPTGVETLPDALLGAGLATRLGARRAGRVQPPPYDDRRDPETLMLNPNGIAEYTSKLADAIGKVLDTVISPLCSAATAASSSAAC
jgi:arginase